MKSKETSEIKLGKDEHRFGNFIVKEEPNAIYVRDLNSMVSWKVNNKFIGKGMFMNDLLQKAIRDKEFEKAIDLVLFVTHYFLTIVPDAEFYDGIIGLMNKCARRYPELYGLKPDISNEEDKDQLQKVKDMERIKEEIEEKTKEIEEEEKED